MDLTSSADKCDLTPICSGLDVTLVAENKLLNEFEISSSSLA